MNYSSKGFEVFPDIFLKCHRHSISMTKDVSTISKFHFTTLPKLSCSSRIHKQMPDRPQCNLLMGASRISGSPLLTHKSSISTQELSTAPSGSRNHRTAENARFCGVGSGRFQHTCPTVGTKIDWRFPGAVAAGYTWGDGSACFRKQSRPCNTFF